MTPIQAQIRHQMDQLTELANEIARDAGMLTRRKEGLQVFYGIGDESIFTLCELVCGSLEQQHAQRAESLAR